jgi:hypothetical protein
MTASLASLSLEETAARLRTSRTLQADPGVRYVRRVSLDAKAKARGRVIRCFGPRSFPGNLALLTMPSVGWDLERQLLSIREHGSGLRRPRRTWIYGIERNEAVYRAAMVLMPGVESTGLIVKSPTEWASQITRTYCIQGFWRCTLADYIHFGLHDRRLSGAWIDLNGPTNLSGLRLLSKLWENIEGRLVITSLAARWTAETVAAMAEYEDGLTGLTSSFLPGARLLDAYSYRDRSPMIQLIYTRPAAPLPQKEPPK